MLESKFKEIAEKYNKDFLDISNLDVAGQLAVIKFYEYLLTKQHKETENSTSC